MEKEVEVESVGKNRPKIQERKKNVQKIEEERKIYMQTKFVIMQVVLFSG